jgi:hypothetical protein
MGVIMNQNKIDLLENELTDLLQKHPHLIGLQFEISKNLAELMDSFYSLKDELSNLDVMLKELK